jgi:hypothetical protein
MHPKMGVLFAVFGMCCSTNVFAFAIDAAPGRVIFGYRLSGRLLLLPKCDKPMPYIERLKIVNARIQLSKIPCVEYFLSQNFTSAHTQQSIYYILKAQYGGLK